MSTTVGTNVAFGCQPRCAVLTETSIPDFAISLSTAAQVPFYLRAPGWQLFDDDISPQPSSPRSLSFVCDILPGHFGHLSADSATEARTESQEWQVSSGTV